VSNLIVTDAQDLEIASGIVELYEIKIGTGSNNTLYFHAGKDLDNGTAGNDLLFGTGTEGGQQTYIAMPIFLEGLEKSAEGAQNRPTLTFANVESIIKNSSVFKTKMDEVDGSNNLTWDAKIDGIPVPSSTFNMDNLIGARVTRRKTLEKYTGDGVTGYEFQKELFLIDRISNKNNLFIEVELASPVDLGGVRLPRRQVVGKYCSWIYQGGATDPSKSACIWKTQQQFEDSNGDIFSFYFTGNDEPLVLASYLTGSSTTFWKGTYSSGTAYALGNFVLHGGEYWRCEKALPLVSGDNGVVPTETAVQWQLVRTYTVWSNSTNYTVNATDTRKNSYVKYDDSAGTVTVWRAVRANSGITPGTDETVWTRGDTCGKLLKSCKIRYQGMPIINESSGSYSTDAIPSSVVDTNIPLPFGAFPGTRKFR
tara:strand:+ start:10572 stop:11843 length:1272 start_codon:yes stop_codon:yes gene_type:complete